MELDIVDNTPRSINDTSSSSHVTPNIATQLIENTLENLPPLNDNSLNDSLHATNKIPSSMKGKDKEIDNPSITKQGLAPITRKHDFNHITTSTNNDLHQQIFTEFNDADQNSDILDISDVQLNTNHRQYISFSPLNSFKHKSLTQLKSSIRHVLNKKFNKDFAGILPIQNFKGVKIVKILFNNKQIRDSINDINIAELNVKFHTYDQINLNRIVEPFLETKRLNTIRVVDIPQHIDNKNILEFIIDELGPINSFEEIIKSQPRDQNRTSTNYNHTRKPNFKQLKVEFSSRKSIENIMSNDIWALPYEDFTLRILPNETQADEFKRRTTYCYKITGIPVTATIGNIEPLLTKLNARTCTFTNFHQKRLTKSAYIYVEPQNYINHNRKMKFDSSSIYVLHPKTPTCTVCGSPSHQYNSCNRSEQLSKAVQHFHRQEFLSMEDLNKKFNNIIKRPNKFQPSMEEPSHKSHSNQRKYQLEYNTINNNNPQISELLQQIKTLNQIIKTQNNTINHLQQSIQTITNDQKELIKDITIIKDSNAHLNAKLDISINKMDQFNFTSQPIDAEASRPQPQRKRRSSSPPKDTTKTLHKFPPVITNTPSNRHHIPKYTKTPEHPLQFQIGSLQSISSYNDYTEDNDNTQGGPSSKPINNNYFQTGPPSTIMETIPSEIVDTDNDSTANAFYTDSDPSQNFNPTSQSKRWLDISGWIGSN
ncbi:hypothetical protein C1645_744101 [Glomus cerebriforme]|uniref:Uncharacterized protein n=1 Tax=Glomus cerebriforme TaxID=658196 RepID=A0A397SGU6_9GLOM|nr:hypothetical protein C1645_744101 [Glomus cerebriforme]